MANSNKTKGKPRLFRRLLEKLRTKIVDESQFEAMRWSAPTLPKGVTPNGETPLIAQDAMIGELGSTLAASNDFGIYPQFRGYAYLAQLAQISEFRAPTTTLATEMTREWIELKSIGDDDHSEQIKAIVAEMDRLKLRDVIKQALEHDGLFGRGMIYIDLGQSNVDSNPLVIDKQVIKKGMLQGFKAIEPIWTTPSEYNSIDPTAKDFYVPTSWYVMGRRIHASRLMLIVSHPLPDMLKPAYNFSGMSMSQMIEPYVFNWLKTRKSVSDVVKSFSFSGIKTNMQDVLNSNTGDDSDGTDILTRVEFYNLMRDNRGLFVLDKDSEEFFQFNTPLSTLDALQAQSQEQMAAPCHIPLVKLFGITPTGLNASSEGEIKVFYDYVHAMQVALIKDVIVRALKVIQLSLFGEIIDGITFDFKPLQQSTPEELANIQKAKAETGASLIEAGVISQAEERQRVASDPNSGYNGLDAEELPNAQADDTQSDTA